MTSRRSFLLGLGAALAAPAIVRAEVLMPVRKIIQPDWLIIIDDPWIPLDGRTLSRETYGELFAAIGTTFGAGDGVTTFELPNAGGGFIEFAHNRNEALWLGAARKLASQRILARPVDGHPPIGTIHTFIESPKREAS